MSSFLPYGREGCAGYKYLIEFIKEEEESCDVARVDCQYHHKETSCSFP